MRLSFEILVERLGDRVVWARAQGDPGALRFGRPEHLAGQGVVRKDRLYLAQPADLEATREVEPDGCVVVVGKDFARDWGARTSVVCVGKAASPFSLMNELQAIFDEFDRWEDALQQGVNTNADYQDLVDVSKGIFGNPVFVSDANYQVLAESENDYLTIKHQYLPERCLLDLRESKDYEVLWEQGLPAFSFHEYRHLSQVLRSRGLFVLFVSVMESDKKITDSIPALLQHLSKYLLVLFERGHPVDSLERNSLVLVVKRLLGNQPTTGRQLQAAVSGDQGLGSGPYRFYCIEVPESDRRFHMTEPHLTRLAGMFGPPSVVFEYNRFFCVLRKGGSSAAPSTLEGDLRAYLAAYGTRAGVSGEFGDLEKVRNYYLQARDVIEVARRLAPNGLLYRFEDYSLDLILRSPHQELAPEFLGHPGLVRLGRLDQERQTQHVRTLKAYFENQFNVSLAAKSLFIHRTTCIDRLAKIEEILGVSLADYRTGLYLMVSLALLDASPGLEPPGGGTLD